MVTIEIRTDTIYPDNDITVTNGDRCLSLDIHYPNGERPRGVVIPTQPAVELAIALLNGAQNVYDNDWAGMEHGYADLERAIATLTNRRGAGSK